MRIQHQSLKKHFNLILIYSSLESLHKEARRQSSPTGNLTFQTFHGKALGESQEQQLSVPCLLPTVNAKLSIQTGKFATQGIILQKLDRLFIHHMNTFVKS